MTVEKLIESGIFEVCNVGESTDREIEDIYCCDLLSVAMGKAPAASAWVTVMGNINTLAVASLADVAVLIIAEGAAVDELLITKANQQGITVLASQLPVFKAALKVMEMMNA